MDIADEIDEILDEYDNVPTRDPRPLSEIIEYDKIGLPV